MMTDPIADLLTRLRNALHAKKESLELPFSNLKFSVLNIMKKEGYISSFSLSEVDHIKKILVVLKYDLKKRSVINKLTRVSRPGRRVYVGVSDIKPVLNGMGISILSTSKGFFTDLEAKSIRVGGELICTIW